MAKKANENYVNHQEILNYAIMYMVKKCEEQIKLCGGDFAMARDQFSFYFVKLRGMCEMYEIETGNLYELAAVSSLDVSDLY